MAKEQIIISAAFLIINLLIGIYLTIYIKDKNPDLNKLNSYIKKYLFFTIKYILPISNIIFLTIKFKLDKFYVLMIGILFSYLVFVFLYEIITGLITKFSTGLITELSTGLITELDERHCKTVDAIQKLHYCNLCICNNLKKHDKEFICTVEK